MNVEEVAIRGYQAEQLLQNNAFLDLLEALEQDALSAMEEASLLNVDVEEDRAKHSECKQRVLAFRLLKEKVNEFIQEGATAEGIMAEGDPE